MIWGHLPKGRKLHNEYGPSWGADPSFLGQGRGRGGGGVGQGRGRMGQGRDGGGAGQGCVFWEGLLGLGLGLGLGVVLGVMLGLVWGSFRVRVGVRFWLGPGT